MPPVKSPPVEARNVKKRKIGDNGKSHKAKKPRYQAELARLEELEQQVAEMVRPYIRITVRIN